MNAAFDPSGVIPVQPPGGTPVTKHPALTVVQPPGGEPAPRQHPNPESVPPPPPGGPDPSAFEPAKQTTTDVLGLITGGLLHSGPAKVDK